MNKGLLIVVSAPSGGGKGTILKEVFEQNNNLRLSVSATTRLPRPGEVEGEHYYFLTKAQFESMIEGGNMLEYAQYCGNFYGTPRKQVEEARNQGFDVVLEIEVQGGAQIKALMPDCVSVFISPPNIKTLEQRLRNRGTEDDATVCKRLAAAKEELPAAAAYDYLIINDQIAPAAKELIAIIQAEKLKTNRNNSLLERIQQTC